MAAPTDGGASIGPAVPQAPQLPTGGHPEGLADLVGRFHPALVHFPIAWLALLVVLDLGALLLGRVAWQRWGSWVLTLTAASFVPAVVTGLLRAGHLRDDPKLLELVVVHRALNLAAAAVVLTALVLRRARRDRLTGSAKAVYLALVVAAVLLVVVAAGYGGKIVFGPHYLPF